MKRFFLTVCYLGVISTSLEAQSLFERMTESTGTAVKSGVTVETVPKDLIKTTASFVVGRGNENDLYSPLMRVAISDAVSPVEKEQILKAPQHYFMQKAQQFVGTTSSRKGDFSLDIGAFTKWYFRQSQNLGIDSVSQILSKEHPFHLASAPLAAAIRAAKQQYNSAAKPLPEDIKIALKNHFSESTLARTRYVVGNVAITLPHFIGQGAKFMENDGYGVTLDNIIVFRSNPGSYATNADWWTHALSHVQQFEKRGIEGFSYTYVSDQGRRLESEVIKRVNTITNSALSSTSTYIPVGTFDMSGAQVKGNLEQGPEVYLSYCNFREPKFGAMFLTTNYGRIIAVNPLDGTWQHIGYCTPAKSDAVAWTFDVSNEKWKYVVDEDGGVFAPVDPIVNKQNKVVSYNEWNPQGTMWSLH